MFKLPNFFLAIKEWFKREKNELQEYVDFLQDTVSENGLRIARLNNELAEKDKIICAKVRIIEDLLKFEKAYQSEIAELRNKVGGAYVRADSFSAENVALKLNAIAEKMVRESLEKQIEVLRVVNEGLVISAARHKKDKLELYRKLGHAQDEIICLKHEFQLLKDKAGKSDVFAQIIGTVKKLGL